MKDLPFANCPIGARVLRSFDGNAVVKVAQRTVDGSVRNAYLDVPVALRGKKWKPKEADMIWVPPSEFVTPLNGMTSATMPSSEPTKTPRAVVVGESEGDEVSLDQVEFVRGSNGALARDIKNEKLKRLKKMIEKNDRTKGTILEKCDDEKMARRRRFFWTSRLRRWKDKGEIPSGVIRIRRTKNNHIIATLGTDAEG